MVGDRIRIGSSGTSLENGGKDVEVSDCSMVRIARSREFGGSDRSLGVDKRTQQHSCCCA